MEPVYGSLPVASQVLLCVAVATFESIVLMHSRFLPLGVVSAVILSHLISSTPPVHRRVAGPQVAETTPFSESKLSLFGLAKYNFPIRLVPYYDE